MSFFGGLGGFWNDFTGKTAANDIKKGTEAANSYLKQGYEDAAGIRKDYYDKSLDFLRPRIKTGEDAENLYRTAIGLNGQDQQRQYYKDFQFDPGYEAELQHGIKALDRSAASRGMLRSGQNVNAIADAGRRWAGNAYQNRLGHYANMFNRGDQASNLAVGATSDLGNSLSDMRHGLGQQYAANVINQQNALANTRNIGLQNVLNIAGTAAKFFGGGGNNTWTSFGNARGYQGGS